MKRVLAAIFLASSMAGVAGALGIAYDQNLANTVITSTQNFVIPMGSGGQGGGAIDNLSAQVAISSVVAAASSFTDGAISTGAITVKTPAALVATVAYDTITISSNGKLAPAQGSVIVAISSNAAVSGSTITVVGTAFIAGAQFTVGASSNATATSLASAINAAVPSLTTSVVGGTLTLTCTQPGNFCNAYQVQTTTVAVVFSTSGLSNLFTGGSDNPVINLNGELFPQGGCWAKADVASNTIVSIANCLDAQTAFFASTNTTTTVLIQTVSSGTANNADTLSVTGQGLSAGAATFAGGQDNAYLIINGQILTQGSQWTVSGSSVQVSTAIVAAIQANTVLNGIISATAPVTCNGNCGVVATTGTIALTSNNYLWFSSTPTALSITQSSLTGGATAGYVLNGKIIALPSHGLATGMALLYSTGTVAITNLANQTTYYAIVVDNNDIQLALTSTGALAGLPITLASQSTSGPHTFTLTPLALSGSVVITWQASDDNVNWASLGVAVLTFASPFATANSIWDFGTINYKYIRANVAGPTNGGANLTIRGFGKRYGLGL